MHIRTLETGDLDTIAEIFRSAYAEKPWNYGWQESESKKYLGEYFAASGFIGFVIEDENRAMGAILCHRRTWWTGDQLAIDELFVVPGQQGKGYGKALLAKVHEYCLLHEIDMLTLMTNKHAPAFGFYLKNEFTLVEHFAFLFRGVM